METRGGLLPPIDSLPPPTKNGSIRPCCVTMCDIVQGPSLCTETASLPRSWNSFDTAAEGFTQSWELAWDKEEMYKWDECAATSKLLLLEGCYVACLNPTRFSEWSLLSASQQRFCANDTFVCVCFFLTHFLFEFCVSFFFFVIMLTRFKWVPSVLYMHLFRTVGSSTKWNKVEIEPECWISVSGPFMALKPK